MLEICIIQCKRYSLVHHLVLKFSAILCGNSSRRKMNRFLLDFEEQNQNDTPLRGNRPRFHRVELPNSRKSKFLASTPQVTVNDNFEQWNKRNNPNLKYEKIKPHPLIPKQIYKGDRFIPCRRGYNFERAHRLLTKKSDENDETRILDVCKKVEMLDVTYRREAFQSMMSKQTFIAGLNQNRILHFNFSAAQNTKEYITNPPNLEQIGKWKCVPRKRPLIGSVEKVFCADDFSNSENENNPIIDWSCYNLISMGNHNCVKVYNSQGVALTTWTENGSPSVVKWSNDGSRLAIGAREFGFSKLVLYDLEKKKILWSRLCYCVYRLLTFNNDEHELCCITIRCICWSLNDDQIIIGCTNMISVYSSDTGTVLRAMAINSILTMNLSPNFKYLAVTTQDCWCLVFLWPEMISHMRVRFVNGVKAIAWHPETSGQLCIGTTNGSLVMCDNVKKALPHFVNTKFHGSVKHLLWNKLSGELLVHWKYRQGDKQYTVVPVLARFDRIVDALPLDKEAHPSFLKFNAANDKLMMFGDDTISIWNFFGNEKPKRQCLPLYSARRKQGVIVYNPIR